MLWFMGSQRVGHDWATELNWTECIHDLPQWLNSKESTCNEGTAGRCDFDPWVQKIPRRRAWQPTPVFNCLENPKDRWAWWAIVHSNSKSQTGLKWLNIDACSQALWHRSRIFFFICPLSKGNKSKNKQVGLHRTKMFLHSEGNSTKWKGSLLSWRRYLKTIFLIRN